MHRVTIPGVVKVGGFDYKIRTDQEAREHLMSGDLWGQARNRFHDILLDPAGTEQNLSKTFIHECLHVIDWIYCGTEVPERHIAQIAHGLLQLFEDMGVRFVLEPDK